MTKIPFNIKYRPQIESGEYKVVTREDRPVEIKIWDLKGDFPVVGVYFDEKNNRDTAVQVTAEGRCSIKPNDDYCDDFFITTNKSVMWSKEDETTRSNCIYLLEKARKYFEKDEDLINDKKWIVKCTDWLKSLEDRVFPQPRQEWTEEDEVCYISIMKHLKYSITNGKPETYTNGRLTDWIEKRAKFLRPQNHWKPSKEQIKPVWHEPDEKPSDKSKVVVWTGEEMVQCNYIFGKFAEKTPTEEHGRNLDLGNVEEPSSVFVSKKSRADLTDLVVKWAYIDDLLNNPDKKEPVSEDLQEEITRYFSKNPIKHLTDWPALKNTALHFANWQREQMIKDAVDGYACIPKGSVGDIYFKSEWVLSAKYPYRNYEKVKLIIIKED